MVSVAYNMYYTLFFVSIEIVVVVARFMLLLFLVLVPQKVTHNFSETVVEQPNLTSFGNMP